MKSIITAHKDPQAYVNRDFRDLVKDVPNPVYFRHRKTGAEYSAIVGGIAWPVWNGEDGCTLIVATSRETEPTFSVLDHFRSSTPRKLIESCFRLRTKYGHAECSEAIDDFIGPPRYEDTVWRANEGIERSMTIIKPSGFDESDSDDLYIDAIKSLSEDKKLIINDQGLLDSLKAMSLSDAEKRLEQFPVAYALGMVLHDMQVDRPWLDHGDSAFNVDDPEHDDSEAFNLE
jgi:hypothetical protein